MITDLTKESIEEFIEIWKEEYGVELSFEEAKERALNIIRFIDLVARKS